MCRVYTFTAGIVSPEQQSETKIYEFHTSNLVNISEIRTSDGPPPRLRTDLRFLGPCACNVRVHLCVGCGRDYAHLISSRSAWVVSRLRVECVYGSYASEFRIRALPKVVRYEFPCTTRCMNTTVKANLHPRPIVLCFNRKRGRLHEARRAAK
jgi:hypothetical protein